MGALTDVVRAARNDHIGVLLRRQAELLVAGLHELFVLVQNVLQCAIALEHVALDAARQSNVRVRVDEDLHVEHLTVGVVVEDENALDEHDVDGRLRRADGY